MRSPPAGLLLALLAYVALRAALLATAFDDVAITMFELHPMGTIPTILLTGGIDIPLRHFYDNAAGQLVTGLLATPLYALLGPSYLALKLVPGLLGLGALVLLWLFLRRWFGQRAALFGALLYALGPATLVKYSVTASGNHFENLFFTLLAIWAVWRLHAPGGRRTARLWLAGYTCGAAVFVFLGSIPPIGLLVLTHLGIVGWRRFGRDLLHATPAFLIGLGPLIVLNLTTRARGGSFLAAKFSGGSAGGIDVGRVATRFVEFFTTLLLPAPTYPDLLGVPGEVANALFVALLAVTWLACVPATARAVVALARGARGHGLQHDALSLRDAALVPLVLYFPITGLAYALTDLRIAPYAPPIHAGGYRYYLPTFLFACILIAVVAARWSEAPRRRLAGRALAGLALVTALFDLGMIRPSLDRVELGLRYEGHYMKQVARTLLGRKQALSSAEVVARAERFPPVFRSRVYEGLGFYTMLQAATAPEGGLADVELEPLVAPWPSERHSDVLRGMGSNLRWQIDMGAAREPAISLLERWRDLDGAATAHVLEGLALAWDVILVRDQERHLAGTLALLSALPPELVDDVTRGLGVDAGRVLRRDIAVEAPWIAGLEARVPEGTRRSFLQGLGIGLADGRPGPGWPRHAAFLAEDEENATSLFGALRARILELHGEGATGPLERFAQVLPAGWRESWSRPPPARD